MAAIAAGGQPSTRPVLRWLLASLLAVGVIVLAWDAAAGAAPEGPERPREGEPEQEITVEVECLLPPDSLMPDDVAAEILLPPNAVVQQLRRLDWFVRFLGVGTWGPEPLFLGNTEPVQVRGERWYVDEATREADDHNNCALARHTPLGDCTQIRADLAPEAPRYGPGGQDVPTGYRPSDMYLPEGMGGGLVPDQCWGRYPSSAYDIHYEDHGFFSWDRKIWAATTSLLHAIGKAAIQISLGLLGIAFATFQTLDYRDFALTAADRYQENLVGPFSLADIAYLALFGFAAIKALTGKLAVAGGEILMTMVLATLGPILLANAEGYLESSAVTMDGLTVAILAAGNGDDPSETTDAQRVVRPAQETLFNEFVDAPFDYINFGTRLDDGPCQERRDRILWANVPNDGGWATRFMVDGGEACERHARSMAEPTTQKLLTSALVAAVCIGVALVVGGASLTLLVAKVLVLVLFALAPFAVAAALLPSTGRRLAWMWVATFLQAFAAGAGMALALSLLLLGMQSVVRQTDGLGPFERWVVLLVIVGVVYTLRARIVAGSQRMAGNFGDRLTRLSPAAAHWQGTGTTGGFDLGFGERAIGRGVKTTAAYGLQHAPLVGLATAGAAYATLAGGIGGAIGRRLSAGQARKNLQDMERYKERRDDVVSLPFTFFRRTGTRSGHLIPPPGGGAPKGGGRHRRQPSPGGRRAGGGWQQWLGGGNRRGGQQVLPGQRGPQRPRHRRGPSPGGRRAGGGWQQWLGGGNRRGGQQVLPGQRGSQRPQPGRRRSPGGRRAGGAWQQWLGGRNRGQQLPANEPPPPNAGGERPSPPMSSQGRRRQPPPLRIPGRPQPPANTGSQGRRGHPPPLRRTGNRRGQQPPTADPSDLGSPPADPQDRVGLPDEDFPG